MSISTSPARVFFLLSTILGTMIATSSSSWLTCWMGLELNLLSFIPLMSSTHNLYKSEAALKYFLIQALGSAIILCWASALIFLSQENADTILLMAIFLKLGAAPFYLWLPSVMQGLAWPQCLLLMTLQKVAPLMLMSYLTLSPNLYLMIYLSSITSALIGGIGGMNQTLVRKMMAYSSINHIGWMLGVIPFSLWSTMNYFLIYTLVTTSVVVIFNLYQIFHISNIISSSTFSPKIQLTLFMAMLSLAGLPPFLGFFPKLLVASNLCGQQNVAWALMLIMSALLTLFFYLRVLLFSLTLSTPKVKFNLFPNLAPLTLPLLVGLTNFTPMLGPLLTFPPY